MMNTKPRNERLLYREEHINCIHYSHEKDSHVELLEIPDGSERYYEINHFMIVFLKRGKVSIDLPGRNIHTAKEGDFFVLSPGTILKAHTDQKTSILTCKFLEEFELCKSSNLENLHKIAQREGNSEEVLCMNKALNYFVQGFEHCIKDGLRCSGYMKIKVMELVYILRSYYSKEELAGLLGPVLTDDIVFKSFILKNWKYAETVDEFARMNNMTTASFRRKFKDILGDSPQKWIVSQKAEAIKEELAYTNKTLYQIADEYRFDSHNSLIRFCKHYLGDTPAKLRKRVDSISIPK